MSDELNAAIGQHCATWRGLLWGFRPIDWGHLGEEPPHALLTCVLSGIEREAALEKHRGAVEENDNQSALAGFA